TAKQACRPRELAFASAVGRPGERERLPRRFECGSQGSALWFADPGSKPIDDRSDVVTTRHAPVIKISTARSGDRAAPARRTEPKQNGRRTVATLGRLELQSPRAALPAQHDGTLGVEE